MTSYTDARGRRRVVVTGMGALTPLGIGVAESWQNAVAGNSGVGKVTQFDVSDMPSQIGGEVKAFDPNQYMEKKAARRMGRSAQLAVAAWQMARDDAGLTTLPDPERVAVMLGTAIGGFDRLEGALKTFHAKGWGRVNPFSLTSSLANMPTHHVSVEAGSLGPIGTQVSACASGVQAIGEAAELIRRDSADIVISGGVDALIQPGAYAGFCAMRAMPVAYNDNPAAASRPFDADRSGFVMSEGGAVLILECLESAEKRNAKIYGEYLGHGSSSDALHMAAPDPTAAGAVRAMKWALQDAGVAPSAVDYINAHGTGTPLNDAGETLAIKTLFGDAAKSVTISSTKSSMGHAMGAAGAIESIFCLKSIETGIIPPTINYETPDPVCDLNYTPNVAAKLTVNVAMSNAFGLGGQNACVVFGRYQ